jgi:LysR family transcriptional activator of nhaA
VWLNYHHLFYFKAIAEEGAVSKAAKKLRLGQPTLSAQLRIFEDSLGIQLFERKHKKLVLTEHGRIALDYAQNIFKMGTEMYEVLHDRVMPMKPTVHIGALDSVPKQILLQIVQLAYQVAPCQVTISEGKSDELLRELVSHRMDLVVTNFVPVATQAKGLFPRLIAKNHVEMYGAKKFAGLRKDFPASLSGQPLIVPTYDSKLRYDLDHWASLNGVELNIVAESQDIGVKKLMAVSALGIVPAATHTVSRQVKSGELVNLGRLEGVHEELYFLAAQRKVANPIAARIISDFKV